MQTVAINTDERSLQKVNAHKKVLIGKDLPRGEVPRVSRGASLRGVRQGSHKDANKGPGHVFSSPGGRRHGYCTAPVVAQVAKDLNSIIS